MWTGLKRLNPFESGQFSISIKTLNERQDNVLIPLNQGNSVFHCMIEWHDKLIES